MHDEKLGHRNSMLKALILSRFFKLSSPFLILLNQLNQVVANRTVALMNAIPPLLWWRWLWRFVFIVFMRTPGLGCDPSLFGVLAVTEREKAMYCTCFVELEKTDVKLNIGGEEHTVQYVCAIYVTCS